MIARLTAIRTVTVGTRSIGGIVFDNTGSAYSLANGELWFAHGSFIRSAATSGAQNNTITATTPVVVQAGGSLTIEANATPTTNVLTVFNVWGSSAEGQTSRAF